jgi:hypothetical protein
MNADTVWRWLEKWHHLLVIVGLAVAIVGMVLVLTGCGADNSAPHGGSGYTTVTQVIGQHAYNCVVTGGGGIWCAP